MYEVTIIDYDHQGRGMARINDKICFIPNTMIDEIVKVNITKEKKNFMEAEAIDDIKKNPKLKTYVLIIKLVVDVIYYIYHMKIN